MAIESTPIVIGSCFFWGSIGSAVVTFAEWGWHNEDYVDKVQPLKSQLRHLNGLNALPENQSNKTILKLAHEEQAVRQQIHQAEHALGPNQNFGDFVNRAGDYGSGLLVGIVGLTALGGAFLGAINAKEALQRKFLN